MAESSTTTHSEPAPLRPVRLLRWMMIYAAIMAAVAVPTILIFHDQLAHFGQLRGVPVGKLAEQAQKIVSNFPWQLKLLIFAIYIALCGTFLPLPTGWLVSAVALRDVALAPNAWLTALLVATVGAAASTLANLTDYHIFVWLMRTRHGARLAHTAFYRKAETWFARRPFALVTAFNVIPIPVDVIRLLAASSGYRLAPFAAANYIGRWVRYFIIALVTFELGNQGWVAVVALLAVAAVPAIIRLALRLRRPKQ